MKLSTLNKFKNKKVTVDYLRKDEKIPKQITGTLEKVNNDHITIVYTKGFVNVLLNDIIKLEEKNYEKIQC